MKLDYIFIYDYIKEYLEEMAVVNYRKGEYIIRSNADFTEVFFILSGNVKVECLTEYGKVFLVDELSGNEFVGKFSYMYEQNLLCDIKAASNVCLLKISKETFNKLQKNSDFLKIFLYKTSKRIYCLYKKIMMKNLFTTKEIFAFYLLNESRNSKFSFKSVSALCDIFPISKKGFYNALNMLKKNNFIRKYKNEITIIDENRLFELSAQVRAFNRINDSKIKLDMNPTGFF